MITVRQAIREKGEKVWTISPHRMAYEALEIMAEKDIGALLVVEADRVAGIFSERDYARKVILRGRSSRETTVGELMTGRVYSIHPDQTIEECMALMTYARCRHVPVIENDRLAGLISIGDAVSALISDQKLTIRDLENYISGNEYMYFAGEK